MNQHPEQKSGKNSSKSKSTKAENATTGNRSNARDSSKKSGTTTQSKH